MANTGYVNVAVKAMYGIPYHKLTAEQKRILHEDSVRRAKLIKEREEAVLKNNLKAFADEAKMEKVLASIYKDCQNQILADVAETMAKVKKAGGTWSYANQSALTRSRGLFEQITGELTKLGQKEQALFTQGLGNIYTDQFLRQVYELGQSIPVKANFNRLNPALIKKTLDYPWSGAMFSDRIWQDKETLGKNLRVGLTQSMILGEGIPEITARINKGIETSQYNAERLARTETKRVTYVAHNDAYEDIGVNELKYYTAGEKSSSTVCSICKADAGKIYKRGEEPTLPRHPNCKCVYIPHVPDTFGENELNELTGSVRGAENYEKWKAEQERKLKKDATLSKEERDYQKLLNDLDSRYKAVESEILGYQNSYSALEAERQKLGGVRRGLLTPEEAGFKSLQDFNAHDAKLLADQQALNLKIIDAQRIKKDLQQDVTYLQTAGVSRIKTLSEFHDIRKSLRNNPTFDYDKYGDELVQMVARMDDDALTINSKIAFITEKNWYNDYAGHGGAHYSPAQRRVNMKMEANSHERALGNGLQGSWQTKLHEEGHQLDHIFAKIDEISGNSAYPWAFTDTATDTGKVITKAINDDILSFLNNAIDYSNQNMGTKYKAVTDLGRISADTRIAFDRYVCYLTSNGVDGKAKCQIGIFTDAIGLHTKDRLSRNTLSCGGWGHDGAYNRARGKSGATSETWATFCALRACGSPEEIAMAKQLMPSTWNCLDGIYAKMADYLRKNPMPNY